MTVERLTLPSQVLQIWPFFQDGLLRLSNAAREIFDVHQMQKMLCALAADHERGYVAVVFTDEGDPIAFGVASDNTLPFSQTRTFEIRAVYFQEGHRTAGTDLLGAFEQWCRDQKITKYSITTKRNTGAIIRCLRHADYGFDKPFLVFDKRIQ